MIQEAYGYIYKITNNLNGKIYIGQKKSPKVVQGYWGSGKVIKQAILKEGIENFSREILDWCSSKVELDEREKYWIAKLQSMVPEIGYNLTAGGDGATPGKPLSEEHKKKISLATRGVNNGNYGNHLSLEAKRKISEANSGKNNVNYGKHSWNYGQKASDETRAKMSASHKGKSHPWLKGVPLTEEHKNKMKISAKTRKYHNSCKNCGCTFEAKGPNKRLCPICDIV